jgi:hypothetical protein
MFGKDKEMFAYEPLGGYRDGRDSVELPWDVWDREARSTGRGIADLFAEPPTAGRRAGPERHSG